MLIILNGSALLAYKPDDINNMTWQQKSDQYPVTGARNFEHMVQPFTEDLLKSNLMPIGEMVDLFYRVEFQQIGSPQSHTCIILGI